MKCIKTIAIGITLLVYSDLTLATVQECNNQQGDYSDNAYNATKTACHKTDEWQKLGTTWTTDIQSESDPSSNDGVSWSTSVDGNTWVPDGELIAGSQIIFQFDVTRAITGNHKYDQLKAWVDWNQDSQWTENETIISEKWWKNTDSDGNIDESAADPANYMIDSDGDNIDDMWQGPNFNADGEWQGAWEGAWNRDIDTWNSVDTTATFFSIAYTIPENLTEILLRARIVCENSLEKYSDKGVFISYGYQDQGEVEDYRLAVKPKPIPAPSTLLVFALGLIALIAQRKRA